MIPDAMEVLFFFFFVTWNALGDQTASRKAVAAAAAMDVPGEYKGDDLIFTSSAVKKVGL